MKIMSLQTSPITRFGNHLDRKETCDKPYCQELEKQNEALSKENEELKAKISLLTYLAELYYIATTKTAGNKEEDKVKPVYA